jgi:transposase
MLLEAGHPVVPVKPNAIKTWRESETGSGAKSDTADAETIADYLRCRAHRLTVAVPYSAETKALRTVVRSRDDLVDMRVAATNQLSALLDAHWPGAKAVFADVESPIALEFLTRYPTARHAQHLGAKRLAAFCAKHGYSGRRTGEQLLTRLHAAPAGTLDETLCEAVRDAVTALVTVLKAPNAALKDLGRSVVAHLGEHPDAETFTSLPRSGQINAAQMLAEWGDCRQAYDGPDSIAALAGVTPVTNQSGKHRAVHFRWACNKRFRRAITTFADNSRHDSPLGRQGLRRRPRPRAGPPARHPRPRQGLDPRHLALLDQPRALRPRTTRQRRPAHPTRTNRNPRRLRLTQGVSWPGRVRSGAGGAGPGRRRGRGPGRR